MLISKYSIGNDKLYLFFSNVVFSVWCDSEPLEPQFIGTYHDCLSYIQEVICDCIENSF